MAQLKFSAGLFLITACTLMLQVLQTRILSVVAWYHLAFFAISMAMFGLTAGAVFVYLGRERFTGHTLSYDLSYFSAAFALTTFICLGVQMALVPVVTWSVTAILTWAQLATCMAVPFFFSGIVVSLALTRSAFPIGRVYGVDLLGAAAGCLGALFILNNTDGPSGIMWVGAVAAVGALLFAASRIGHEPEQKPPLHALLAHRKAILGYLVAAAFANGMGGYGLQPLVAKGIFEGGDSYIFREWNTFSRVVVAPTHARPPQMWGPSPKLRPGFVVEQRGMNIDGDASTTAFRFTGRLVDVDFLKYDITNLAYFLPDRTRAAIIGIGGGRDILSAAAFGYRDITGVELNPVFVKLLVREPGFADFTNFARLRGVHLVVDEGRSWFARTDQRFDIIQMSLIDTWAATGAGAFSLSENGLYTVEAWQIFLDSLTERGLYTVSRWYNPDDPSETARLLSLAVAALLERRVAEPWRHIVLATQNRIATLLVARAPLAQSDLRVLEDVAANYEHRLLVSPTAKIEAPILERIVTARDRESLHGYTSGFAFDLTPPTDDRPFFFNQVPLDKPVQALKIASERIGRGSRLGGVRDGNLVATATLVVLFVVSLVLVLTTIVVPLRPAVRDVGRRLALGGTLYFLCIGFGFMLVEIGLLQRTSVFLGHPVYSLSVLLFTLILSTGVGSLVSDKLELTSRGRFVVWAVLTAGYVMGLPLWFANVFPAFESAVLPVKVVLCIAIMAPAGILMGFAFPTGMRLISLVDRRPTPWLWGVNGAAGVLASIVAVVCNIAFGISVTLLVGGACYLLLIPTALALIWPQQALPDTVQGASPCAP
jgi:hypothetical protein